MNDRKDFIEWHKDNIIMFSIYLEECSREDFYYFSYYVEMLNNEYDVIKFAKTSPWVEGWVL